MITENDVICRLFEILNEQTDIEFDDNDNCDMYEVLDLVERSRELNKKLDAYRQDGKLQLHIYLESQCDNPSIDRICHCIMKSKDRH